MTSYLIDTAAGYAYDTHVREIEASIQKIQERLVTHREKFGSTSRKNWGYTGDVEHVNSELRRLADFLK